SGVAFFQARADSLAKYTREEVQPRSAHVIGRHLERRSGRGGIPQRDLPETWQANDRGAGMILVDTDIYSLYLREHPLVVERARRASEQFAITVMTQIEVLSGRFESVRKAENDQALRAAQHRLKKS